jgi:hypothetical protein
MNIDAIINYFDQLYKLYDKVILYHPNKDNYYHELSESNSANNIHELSELRNSANNIHELSESNSANNIHELSELSNSVNNINELVKFQSILDLHPHIIHILNKDKSICYSYITKKTEISEKYMNELKYINIKIYNDYMNELGKLYSNYPLYDYLIHQYYTGKCNLETINYEDGLKIAIKLLYKNNKFNNLDNPYQSDPTLIMNYLDSYYGSVYYLRIEHLTIERIKKCINSCCFDTAYHLSYIDYVIDDLDIVETIISNRNQDNCERIKYINLSNEIMKNDDLITRLHCAIPKTISIVPIHLINADFFIKLIDKSFDVLYKLKNIDNTIKNIFYDLFPEIICNIDFYKIENIFYIHFLHLCTFKTPR